MSKVVFFYDGPLSKDSKNNYYGIALNNEMFLRYFYIANYVSVCIRVKEIDQSEQTKKYSKLILSNFTVIECPNISSIKGILNRTKAKMKITKLLSGCNFTIVRLPSMIGILAINICKKVNKPYLIELVGCPWDSLRNHSLKGKLIAPFMYLATKRIIKNAPYVIYVTNEFLQNRYPTKGKSIGCSDVQLGTLDENILSGRIEKIKNIDGKIILGTVAAINVKYKGQQYVIEAIAELNKKGHNFEYHLIGGGETDYLESIAKKYNVLDKVKFVGALPHDKVFEYLDNIDIYIHPSLTEGLPRVIIEAMSRACPVVGSVCGGTLELINKKYSFYPKKIIQICNILKGFNSEVMIEEAKRSFELAKEYESELLESRRKEILIEFKNDFS